MKRFSDRGMTDAVVAVVLDVGCCLCFTGRYMQQNVGAGGTQKGDRDVQYSAVQLLKSLTSSEPWQYLAFIFSPLCCPRTALASYLCQSESHSSWNKLLSPLVFGNVCALKG